MHYTNVSFTNRRDRPIGTVKGFFVAIGIISAAALATGVCASLAALVSGKTPVSYWSEVFCRTPDSAEVLLGQLAYRVETVNHSMELEGGWRTLYAFCREYARTGRFLEEKDYETYLRSIDPSLLTALDGDQLIMLANVAPADWRGRVFVLLAPYHKKP
jgi:hypothetical protein